MRLSIKHQTLCLLLFVIWWSITRTLEITNDIFLLLRSLFRRMVDFILSSSLDQLEKEICRRFLNRLSSFEHSGSPQPSAWGVVSKRTENFGTSPLTSLALRVMSATQFSIQSCSFQQSFSNSTSWITTPTLSRRQRLTLHLERTDCSCVLY